MSTASEGRERPAVKLREVDYFQLYLAPVGYGKTERLLAECWLATMWALVVVHDQNCQIRDNLHDGTRIVVRRHKHTDDLDKYLKSVGGPAKSPRELHVIERQDPDVVFGWCFRTADKGQRWLIDGEQYGIPVVFGCDEAANWKKIASLGGSIDEELRSILVQRRHHHLGLVLGSQNAQGVHKQAKKLATEIHVGQFTGSDDVSNLFGNGVHEFDVARMQALDARRREWLVCIPNKTPPDLQALLDDGLRPESAVAFGAAFPRLRGAELIAKMRAIRPLVRGDLTAPKKAWLTAIEQYEGTAAGQVGLRYGA